MVRFVVIQVIPRQVVCFACITEFYQAVSPVIFTSSSVHQFIIGSKEVIEVSGCSRFLCIGNANAILAVLRAAVTCHAVTCVPRCCRKPPLLTVWA